MRRKIPADGPKKRIGGCITSVDRLHLAFPHSDAERSIIGQSGLYAPEARIPEGSILVSGGAASLFEEGNVSPCGYGVGEAGEVAVGGGWVYVAVKVGRGVSVGGGVFVGVDVCVGVGGVNAVLVGVKVACGGTGVADAAGVALNRGVKLAVGRGLGVAVGGGVGCRTMSIAPEQ
jgi:hypothetical protein